MENLKNLNEVIELVTSGVATTPQNHPDRAAYLSTLGNLLGKRFEQTGSINDLNRAVEAAAQAVDIMPQDCPDEAAYLSNLGDVLRKRFEKTQSINDLNRAIETTVRTVDITPQDCSDQASSLTNLGNLLGKRFEQTGSINDLNQAVEAAARAVDITPQDCPDKASYLNNLGNKLGKRFERTGSINDLNRAIEVMTRAVDTTPQNHSNRAGRLNNLGIWLGRRFRRTNSINDLNRAVEVVTQAVNITPQNYPDRAIYLNSLGAWHGTRFERTNSSHDLNQAIEITTQAINITPQSHPNQTVYLNNLGAWLGTRYEQTESLNDLNKAIEFITQAVNTTPQNHPDRSHSLSNLGQRLGKRFERTKSADDLSRAIEAATRAVDASPQDHPDRALSLNLLGNWLITRSELTDSIDDLNRARSSYEDGWDCQLATPSIRISSARAAASIASSQDNWIKSSELLQQAVFLLPALSPRSLKHTDTQHALASFSGLASDAAAIALNAGEHANHALQLLELGRGVIAGLLMDMRGDVSDLKLQHPNLANEFVSLRDELDSQIDGSSSLVSAGDTSFWESQVKRRREVDDQFKRLINNIRRQCGFENFLLPPTTEDLMSAADPDPIIVINVTSYRSDAFLVKHDCINVKVLPTLKLEEVKEKLNHLQRSGHVVTSELLEWLWDVICRPCLNTLGFTGSVSDDNWPRVWWVPTGLVSQLPLHAAGCYSLKSTDTDTVLDRVMSSYASSIRSLLHGRRNHAKPGTDSALLVAMHETPNLRANGTLHFARMEVDMLKRLSPSLQLRPIIPLLHKEDVLKHLRTCKVFHFAGHGKTNLVDPSQSSLLLEDWETTPLTVGDLRNSKLQEHPPFLAYLSACSTAANEVVDLADEGIHLVNACQLAGFRHVVGTLWEVSDKYCVDVAGIFYETMREEGMKDVTVCRGLHKAVRALRDGEINAGQKARDGNLVGSGTPARGLNHLHWIPYVHFGV